MVNVDMDSAAFLATNVQCILSILPLQLEL